MEQARAVCEYITQKTTTPNDYVIHANAIMSSLAFSPDADGFESSLQKLGQLIGFISTRPEKETCGEGPDNLWAIGNNKYFVIECKSAAISETISKDYCNQLGGAIRWFSNEYGELYSSIPVMVHKSTIIDRQATAVPNMMIITPDCLDWNFLFYELLNMHPLQFRPNWQTALNRLYERAAFVREFLH